MKKLLLTFVLLATLTVGTHAHSIRYFTYSQVSRTVSYLNAQDELMIYCGYPDEIETYVILNEVWAERVNSKFFEVWVFGYDGYTGEDIYMPVDLECIWLPSTGGRYYNAAQYLRFRTNVTTPTFMWAMPAYNRFTRTSHVPGHRYTYHWDIHRPGWRCPAWDPYGATPPPYHPYYMREPGLHSTYVYNDYRPWTPGTNERPMTPSNGYSNRRDMPGNSGIHNNGGRSTDASRNSGNTRSGNSFGRSTTTTAATGTRSRNTTTGTPTNSRGNEPTTSSRSTNTTRNTGITNSSRSTNRGTTSRGTVSNASSNRNSTSTQSSDNSRSRNSTAPSTPRDPNSTRRSTNRDITSRGTVSSASSSRSSASAQSSDNNRSRNSTTPSTPGDPNSTGRSTNNSRR